MYRVGSISENEGARKTGTGVSPTTKPEVTESQIRADAPALDSSSYITMGLGRRRLNNCGT